MTLMMMKMMVVLLNSPPSPDVFWKVMICENIGHNDDDDGFFEQPTIARCIGFVKILVTMMMVMVFF